MHYKILKILEEILEMKNIVKEYSGFRAVDNVNFSMEKGEIVAIIGPSGSGKSTLLRCMNLLEIPDGGEILYHGEDIRQHKNINSYRAKVGMVFQSFNLFENKSVIEGEVNAEMEWN